MLAVAKLFILTPPSKLHPDDAFLFAAGAMIVVSVFISSVLLMLWFALERMRLTWAGCLAMSGYHVVVSSFAFAGLDFDTCTPGPVIFIQLALGMVWVISAPVTYVHMVKKNSIAGGGGLRWGGLFY